MQNDPVWHWEGINQKQFRRNSINSCGGLRIAGLRPADSSQRRPGASELRHFLCYGTVTDPTGPVIPGAVVTLTEQNTQATTTKTATDSGDFAFTFVPPGTYTLRIDAKGFKPLTTTGMTLSAGQQLRQTFALEVGPVTESVSVEAATPLVNTVSAQQLHSYTITDAQELPLQNRNFTGLLKINAGIVANQETAEPA